MKRRSVLFVCTGNTCRSPMAEAVLRHMFNKEGITHIDVFSRGVSTEKGYPMSSGAQDALKKAGVPVSTHQSAPLLHTDIEKADWIFAMTQDHLAIILSQYPEAKAKTRRLAETDITDPIGGSLSDYEKCRIDIQNALLDLIHTFKSEGSSKP